MILEVLPYKSKFNLENNESVTLVEKFAKKEDAFHKFWNIKISELSSEGKIAVWGAGAKGITFVNLLDPHKKWIDYLIDLNPKKHNKFAVGTGHPIINFTEINNQNIKTVIVMNPNYLDEINLLLKQNSFKVDVIVAQNSNNLLSS